MSEPFKRVPTHMLDLPRGMHPLTAPPPFGWCLPCIILHKMAELEHKPAAPIQQAVTLVNGSSACYGHVGVEIAE